MPFQIKEEDGKFCVYNLDTEKKEGEYPDRLGAMKRMKALYANEKDTEGKPSRSKKDSDDGEDDE